MFLGNSRYTIDEIVDMMELNEDGKMEFPRDLMVQDCLETAEEPLFGFVTNVTLVTEKPCIQDVECFGNGTLIDSGDEILEVDDILLDTNEEESFNSSTNPTSTNNETSSISDHVLAHRISAIERPKSDKIRLQMFNLSNAIIKENNTQSRPFKRGGIPPNSLLNDTLFDNTSLEKSKRAKYLSDARISFSDPDFSRALDIDYIFGRNYLKTYQKKGRYEVTSIVPRLSWDHLSLLQAQERADMHDNGNLRH